MIKGRQYDHLKHQLDQSTNEKLQRKVHFKILHLSSLSLCSLSTSSSMNRQTDRPIENLTILESCSIAFSRRLCLCCTDRDSDQGENSWSINEDPPLMHKCQQSVAKIKIVTIFSWNIRTDELMHDIRTTYRSVYVPNLQISLNSNPSHLWALTSIQPMPAYFFASMGIFLTSTRQKRANKTGK